MSETNNLECAVVVGKKVDKKAVVRNSIKRHLVSGIKESLSPTTPIKMVVFVKKQIKDTTQEEIKDELIKAFRSIQIQ